MNKSNTFCVLPWMHLATDPNGNYRVCCNSIPGENRIRSNNDEPYKIFKNSIEDAWNSDFYKNIRKQLLNNERPAICQRCFREEDAGIFSARQSANRRWIEDKEYTSDAPLNIRYVDIRLGNLCNLKCRMCNPYASNQWVDEWHLINESLSESEVDRLSKMTWPENTKTWENLFSIAHSVEEIYLTGGEPTIIKEQHTLLDFFIDNGTAKDKILKYNTNLTNIPSHLISKWEKFKLVRLNCSIDAVGKLDRYIRYPSNWNAVEKNFLKLRKLKNVAIEIHCTVQMYNILKLDELIDWALPFNHKIYFNILNHPEELNIRVLPKYLKEKAESKLQKYLHLEKVQGIIDYMNTEDWNNRFDEFLKYTNVLDNSRSEKLTDIVPELLE
jgi:molybdenum cofactor biosynthesis enzyme MoaA